MVELVLLAAVAGAVWYFWPQIMALVGAVKKD
jgi:hypothetical protein